MYCDKCKKNPATVHFTKIINGDKYEGHLCAQCAQKEQEAVTFQQSFTLPNFLAALFNLNPQLEEAAIPRRTIVCEKCGLSFEQITEQGRLGCNQCYDSFGDKLEPLLRRIHSSGQHLGKVPSRRGGPLKQKKEIERLRTLMQQSISREDFEQAAQIRDQIRSLEQGFGG